MSVPQKGLDQPIIRGDHMRGYCWLHDTHYRLEQGDEVCPRCERNYERDLEWRQEDYAESIEDLGDFDDEE